MDNSAAASLTNDPIKSSSTWAASVTSSPYHFPLTLASANCTQKLRFLIHSHIREDAFALYGFLSSREKHLFEMLLSASGVGPSLALKILSGMSAEELIPAIRGNDLVRLTKIPGVGRKTAERMVVELKDKLESMAVLEQKPSVASPAGVEADVLSALLNLGYDGRTAENAVSEGKREAGTSNFEKLLKATLQSLTTPKGKAARVP